ncbi:MAG: hypothetical protein Q9214_001891, partial [Letrouitia sp. 1 TL-2023]
TFTMSGPSRAPALKCQRCRNDRQAVGSSSLANTRILLYDPGLLDYSVYLKIELGRKGNVTAVNIMATTAAQPYHRLKDLPRPITVRQVVAGMYALCHIQWDNTGLYDDDVSRNEHNFDPKGQITLVLIQCLSLGNFRPSNVVLYHLWERANCVRFWDEFDDLYQTILTRENSTNAKHLAKEQYAQKILRGLIDKKSPLSSLDAVKEAVDEILLRGERWRILVQAVHSVDILMIYQSRGTADMYSTVGDVVDHGSDEDFDRLKRQVLDPKYRMRETCLLLTGVRDMILNLVNAPVRSELRKYLATAIKTRIQSVFKPLPEEWPDVVSRKMLIITDPFQRNIVDILGMCIVIEFDWSHVRPGDSPWDKFYQMYKQSTVGKEHTQGDDDFMEIDEGEMQPDSGPTPPGAYAGLTPSNFLQFE